MAGVQGLLLTVFIAGIQMDKKHSGEFFGFEGQQVPAFGIIDWMETNGSANFTPLIVPFGPTEPRVAERRFTFLGGTGTPEWRSMALRAQSAGSEASRGFLTNPTVPSGKRAEPVVARYSSEDVHLSLVGRLLRAVLSLA